VALRQNALLLLLLTVLAAIAGDWSGQAQLTRYWCLPAGLLLLGLAYEAWMTNRAAQPLRCSCRRAGTWAVPTPVAYELRHASPRLLRFELAPAAPPEVTLDRALATVSVPAGASGRWMLTATARRLGRFPWPQSRTSRRRRARAGLVELSAFRRRTDAGAARYPARQRTPIGALTRGAQPMQRVGSGSEVLQLREYQPGDAPRAIDWKASARRRRLISRDFSEDQHLEILIALDAGRASGLAAGDSDRLALYANVAARLAQRATLLDDRVGLLIYADRPLAALAPGRGVAALAGCAPAWQGSQCSRAIPIRRWPRCGCAHWCASAAWW
jgi:uncharacterized protein (DUF58 family)